MDAVSWLEWWTAERVIALAAVGQLVVLVAAALFARAQVREARELRAEQARPFVVVDFELDRRPLINLVVANLGKTMARNVRITVDPPLRSTVYDSFGSPIGKLKLFTEVVPSLAPGKRIVLLFDSVPQRTEAGLPDSYQVRLSYEWDGGRPIVDTQRLDLDLYRHQRLVWQPYPCVGFAGLDEMTASRAAGEEGESPPRHAPLDDWRSGRSGPQPGTGPPPRGRTKPSVRESRDDVGGGSGGGLSSEPGPAIEVAVGRLLVGGGHESTP